MQTNQPKKQINDWAGKPATCTKILKPGGATSSGKPEYCNKPAIRLGHIEPGMNLLDYLCAEHENWLPNMPDAPRGASDKNFSQGEKSWN